MSHALAGHQGGSQREVVGAFKGNLSSLRCQALVMSFSSLFTSSFAGAGALCSGNATAMSRDLPESTTTSHHAAPEAASIGSPTACGLGLALVPRLLVEDELARGTLVVACERALLGQRAYCLVQPQRDDERPALTAFKTWLLATAGLTSAA